MTLPGIYGFRGDYHFLSNFYIEPDGSHVEREYQRAKCARAEDRKRFDALSPSHAKKLGRQIQCRSDWESVKVDIMEFYVRKKFRDHPTLLALLRNTQDLYLEETNWWHDHYWGVCDGRGLNVLGHILMWVRVTM